MDVAGRVSVAGVVDRVDDAHSCSGMGRNTSAASVAAGGTCHGHEDRVARAQVLESSHEGYTLAWADTVAAACVRRPSNQEVAAASWCPWM